MGLEEDLQQKQLKKFKVLSQETMNRYQAMDEEEIKEAIYDLHSKLLENKLAMDLDQDLAEKKEAVKAAKERYDNIKKEKTLLIDWCFEVLRQQGKDVPSVSSILFGRKNTPDA